LGSNSFGHWFNDETGGFLQHSPVKITVLKLRVSIAPGSVLIRHQAAAPFGSPTHGISGEQLPHDTGNRLITGF
jgi:hypothetical protein